MSIRRPGGKKRRTMSLTSARALVEQAGATVKVTMPRPLGPKGVSAERHEALAHRVDDLERRLASAGIAR